MTPWLSGGCVHSFKHCLRTATDAAPPPAPAEVRTFVRTSKRASVADGMACQRAGLEHATMRRRWPMPAAAADADASGGGATGERESQPAHWPNVEYYRAPLMRCVPTTRLAKLQSTLGYRAPYVPTIPSARCTRRRAQHLAAAARRQVHGPRLRRSRRRLRQRCCDARRLSRRRQRRCRRPSATKPPELGCGRRMILVRAMVQRASGKHAANGMRKRALPWPDRFDESRKASCPLSHPT